MCSVGLKYWNRHGSNSRNLTGFHSTLDAEVLYEDTNSDNNVAVVFSIKTFPCTRTSRYVLNQTDPLLTYCSSTKQKHAWNTRCVTGWKDRSQTPSTIGVNCSITDLVTYHFTNNYHMLLAATSHHLYPCSLSFMPHTQPTRFCLLAVLCSLPISQVSISNVLVAYPFGRSN